MLEPRRPFLLAAKSLGAIQKSVRLLAVAGAFLIGAAEEAHATHAMGGELTYECIGPNLYRVRLNFYRDCNGVAAPSNCNNGRRFRMRSDQCNVTLEPCFGLDDVEIVTPICLSAVDRCVNSAGQYGIQRYRYSTVVDLSAYAACGTDWLIDWDLCCRNNAITSLNNPGSRNLYLYAELNSTLTPCNNSPRYLNDPTPFACVGQTVSYNHGFNDIDGDSLSFELAPALGANGSLIPYNPGYSFLQPIITSGGANAVQIDPVTGTITFVPSIQQFSVVTVKVSEWRNGVKIGTYLRDVQFAIVVCANNNPSVSGINGTGQFATTVCANEQICFNVAANDIDPGQVVTMTWNSGIPGATFTVTGSPLPTGQFCWTPTPANIGQNLFSVTVADDACILNGVNNYGFVVQVTPPVTPANAGPDQEVCGFTATMQGVLPYPQIGRVWSVVSGSGTFANPNSPTTTVSGLGPGPNVFQWTLDFGTCGTTSDQVTITAYDPGQQVANAGPDQALCTPQTSTMLAANAAAVPATGQWSVVSGTGVFADPGSPTTTVSGLGIGNNVFRWTISNGPCGAPTFDQVTITVFNSGQAAANAGPDQQLCAPANSATLAANAAAAPATGQWTVVSGSGTFVTAASPTTAVNGLSIGPNVLRWTINNGACDPASTFDDLVITVFDPASPAANAGPDQQVCSQGTLLAGNAPLPPATGQWTVITGTGTFVDPASPTTAVNGLSIGTNVFQWTLSNGPCPNGVTTDQVTVVRFDANAVAANAGPDQQLCTPIGQSTATGTLAGNAPTPPSAGTWTLISGSGTITAPGSPTSTVTGLGVGVNVFQWTINNGPCVPSVTSDQVTITVFSSSAPAANAGPDQELCAPVASVTLAANAAFPPGTGQWTVVSGTGVFANAASPTTTVSGMSIGDNVYQWTLSNGPCPGAVTSDQVTIRLFDPAQPAANAGPDQQICGTATTTLIGSPVSFPATGTWTLVSGTGTIVNPTSSTTVVNDILVGESVFQWTVSNGPCGSSSDQVTVQRFSNQNPAANAGPDQSICVPTAPNQVTMAGSVPIFPAIGTWTVVSGGGSFADANSPTTLVTGMSIGVNVFQWTVDNGPCAQGITTDQVTVTVFDAGTPTADAGPDQSLCSSSGSATMAGSALIGPATGLWTLVSGTGTIVSPGDPNTAVTGLAVGQNIFQWTVNNGPCQNGLSTDQMSIFVYDPLQPSADAGSDQSICTTAGNTITLNGSPVIFPATGLWTMSGGPGTIVDPTNPSTLVIDLASGVYSFTWTVNNGVCPDPISSSTLITVVADGNAQPALAGPDQAVCGTAVPVVMAANEPEGVATGQWTVVQGSANFSDPTSHTATVTGLSIGVNILQWNIDNAECGITTDQVTILVFDPNQPPANAGPDQQLCTPQTSTTLVGNALTIPATGQWTLVSGSGTIANPAGPVTAVSGLALGENIFQWSINNGACPNANTSDLVSVFVFASDAQPANAGPDQEICTPQSSVSMAANAVTGSAVGTWTLVNGGGVITAPNDPNTTITGLPVGANTFAWTIDNGSCGTTTDQVTIFVFDAQNPVANAGPDQELCTPQTSTTLAGSAVIFPATGQWTLVSGTGIVADASNPNTTVSGLSVGANVFAWTVENGPCANSLTTDQVTILVFDQSNSAANAGPDQQFCTPVSSTVLAGSTATFPATGLWTVVSGSAVIASPASPTTAVTGLGVGETILAWTVSNGPCDPAQTTDQLSIFIFDETNPVADAGPDQELCTPQTSTTLAGSAVIFPATGLWTLISGGGTIADPTSPTSTVSGLPVGVNVFRWTVSNGPCAQGITFDDVAITVFDENNAVANAGPDQELCTPLTVATLSGSPLIFPATGEWTLVSGQGVITSPNSPVTTVTGLAVGENIFAWTVSNGPCANGITTDQVSIFLFDQNNAQPNAGPDQELCTPNTSTVMQAAPVTFPASGIWTLVSGGGTIADPADPNTTISGLPVGANVFAWTVDNGPCATGVGSDQVTILVFDENNPLADAGPDQQLCTATTTSTTLTGSAVIFPATGEWTLVSGTGTIVSPNSPVTTVLDLEIGTSVFQWTVSNGPCDAGSSDQVTIEVFDLNNAVANAGPDQDLCTPTSSASLSASAVVFPAIGTWTIISGGGIIADPNSPNTTITGLQVGVTVLEWSVDNGPCPGGATSDQLTITLYEQENPLADAGPDQQLCTPTGTTTSTTLFGSNIIFPATGTWTLVSGTGIIASPNSPITGVTGLSIGANTFLWTVSNGVCIDPLTTDLVTILVFDENNPDADAGPDQQVCTPLTSATMAGSPVTFPAEGTWTLIGGQGTITDPNDPNTTITDLGIGVNVFEWTVANGVCPNGVTTSQVTITLFDADAPPADAGPDQELCAPDDTATLTGNEPVGAAIGTWTLVQGTGVIADANAPVTTVSGLEVGENIFVWTLEGGECVTTTDQVSIFVFDPKNADAFAGLDQELCVPQDSVYMAGSPVIFPAQGTWTVVAGAGTPVDPSDPLTLIQGLAIGVNTFQWTVYNGPCSNGLTIDQVTIILYDDTTAAANAGPDLELCLPETSIQLQGETPPPPAQGTWTLISGSGTPVSPNDPNTLITGLAQGINTFVWTLEWDPCPNNGILSDTVSVYVYDPSAPVADAGPDQELCTPDSETNLQGNTPAIPGVGTWTVTQGGSTVVEPNNPNTLVTGLDIGVHEFVWEIYNGQCGFGPPSRDTVRVSVFDGDAPDAMTGDDISWCTPTNSAVLQANDPVFPATGTWTSLSGTGTIADPNDPNTAVFNLGVGQHDFLWTIDNGACGTSSADISVFIFDGNAPPANAGPDQELCTPQTSTTLAGNAPVFPATGLWTLVSGTGTIASPASPTSAVSGLSIGVNTFLWTIDNGPCGTTEDLVTIVVYDQTQGSANAGPDQEICTPASSVTLQANAVGVPAIGTWTIISGSGTLSDPNDPNATLSGLTVGQVTLQWTVDNGPCSNGTTTDQVTIFIFDGGAQAAAAGPDQSYCTPITQAVTMFASSPVPPGTGIWSLASGAGNIADPSSPFTAITGLGLGTNVFVWTIDNGACGSTSDEMVIQVFDHTVPPADAGPDQQFCQDVSTTNLDAVPATSTAFGAWSLLMGTGNIVDAFDPMTLVTGMQQGNNWFVWTVDNGVCGTTADTMLVFIKDCLTLTIPDAFSPNGDGVNDTFVIRNLESYPNNSFQVFNRWGNKILDRSPYNNDWDGTSQYGAVFGEKLPESTYYYVLDLGNDTEAYTGFIYLRR
ncbi:MAG: gliding motility-associated C-terminal domain-containing protein [Flavobacteriales bacterium]|nr:gliding motility-associated C-terminal domain-containing protein [Flavobacteriales bacterium]